MAYSWNGQEFDDQTQQGATGAGLAGALAGMSSVSGFKWNGIADWLSRGVAGLYAGRDEYMSKAFDDKMQSETQARLKEESVMRQEYQKEQMDKLRRDEETYNKVNESAGLYVESLKNSPDVVAQSVFASLPPEGMFENKAKYAEFVQQRIKDAHKEVEDQQHWTSAIKILEGHGIQSTGDPTKDIASADQLRDFEMKAKFDPQLAATRDNTAAAREALAEERRMKHEETARDDLRANVSQYEGRESERAKMAVKIYQDLVDPTRTDPKTFLPIPPMPDDLARKEARKQVDEFLPSLPNPSRYVSPSRSGGPSPFMPKPGTAAPSKPYSAPERPLPGGRLDITMAQAMNEGNSGFGSVPVTSGPAPVTKTEVNPSIGKMKQGFVLSVLETAVKSNSLPPKILEDWNSGDLNFRSKIMADVAALVQQRGISPQAALILVTKNLAGVYTNALRERDGEIPH